MGETAPFWRFSAASYPDLEGTVPAQPILKNRDTLSGGNSSDPPRVHTLSHDFCAICIALCAQ